jgi:acetyl-CoA C-acetyltransferase
VLGCALHRVAGDDEDAKARLRFEITLEQALEAPIVVTPFGLYDCAPQSDGAAALVLAADEVVDRFTDRPVWIRGVGLGLDSVMHQHKPDMTTFFCDNTCREAGVCNGKHDAR